MICASIDVLEKVLKFGEKITLSNTLLSRQMATGKNAEECFNHLCYHDGYMTTDASSLSTIATMDLEIINSGQSFLIQFVKELAEKETIGVEPDIPVPVIKTTRISQPQLVSFCNVSHLEQFVVSKDWCHQAFYTVSSIIENGIAYVEQHINDLNKLNSLGLEFARKIQARLPSFLDSWILFDRPELLPGAHWHWDSLISKLIWIGLLIVLSGHVPDGINLRQEKEEYVKLSNHVLVVDNDQEN